LRVEEVLQAMKESKEMELSVDEKYLQILHEIVEVI
jgi:hypothetical protein